ncbi:MAG: slipin family protein [Armatimonadetes bacterium]|jgi:regulator of protease activity HflC (stomatin/prohibitin superfamily)|nr:slipin family protein [Armatimonadota bacterium]
METLPWTLIGILAFLVLIVGPMLRITQEYERAVVFRLGRLVSVRGPGLIILIPYIERMVRVDLRVVTMDVPKQDTMTKDNVPVAVDAVVYFQVVDPAMAITKVESYVRATALISQTNLRSTIGQSELDELLAKRDDINDRLQKQLDLQTEPWGVKVNMVEVRDVVLPEAMRRAMARQAEVERERRAKIINAEGEFQAAAKLLQAADTMAQNPITIQLRYLQTVSEVATENNSTTLFPLPIDLLKPFLPASGSESGYPKRPMPPPPDTLTGLEDLGTTET